MLEIFKVFENENSFYISGLYRLNLRLNEDYTNELNNNTSQEFKAIETRIKNAVCVLSIDISDIFLVPYDIILYDYYVSFQRNEMVKFKFAHQFKQLTYCKHY